MRPEPSPQRRGVAGAAYGGCCVKHPFDHCCLHYRAPFCALGKRRRLLTPWLLALGRRALAPGHLCEDTRMQRSAARVPLASAGEGGQPSRGRFMRHTRGGGAENASVDGAPDAAGGRSASIAGTRWRQRDRCHPTSASCCRLPLVACAASATCGRTRCSASQAGAGDGARVSIWSGTDGGRQRRGGVDGDGRRIPSVPIPHHTHILHARAPSPYSPSLLCNGRFAPASRSDGQRILLELQVLLPTQPLALILNCSD